MAWVCGTEERGIVDVDVGDRILVGCLVVRGTGYFQVVPSTRPPGPTHPFHTAHRTHPIQNSDVIRETDVQDGRPTMSRNDPEVIPLRRADAFTATTTNEFLAHQRRGLECLGSEYET